MADYGGSFFRTLRGRRHSQYAYQGFLPFESFQFSKIPLNVPYTVKLRSDRLKQYKWAMKQGWSKTRWANYIKQDVYGGDLDAWRLLRQYEQAWREDASPNDPYLLLSRERKAQRRREYSELNKGRIREQKIRWREKHREQIAKYSKSYRLKKRQEKNVNG